MLTSAYFENAVLELVTHCFGGLDLVLAAHEDVYVLGSHDRFQIWLFEGGELVHSRSDQLMSSVELEVVEMSLRVVSIFVGKLLEVEEILADSLQGC